MRWVVHGQNGLAVQERVARLRAEVDPQGFSTTVLDLTHSRLSDVRTALLAAPFFGGQRLVVLRGPAALSRSKAGADEPDEAEDVERDEPADGQKPEWRDVVPLLADAPSTTSFICWIAGTLPSNHVLARSAREANWAVEAQRIPRGQELLVWISSRVQAAGATIAPNAVELLLDLLYPTVWRAEGRWDTTTIDMQLIASEIDKLVCAAEDDRIERGLVENLVADRGGYAAFKLSDQIFAGRVESALTELEANLSAGEAAEKLVSQLAGDVIIRSVVRSTSDLAPDDVAAALKTSAARVNTSRGKAAANDPAALADAAEELRHVEWAVKTGRSRDTTTTIVPLVATVAARFSQRRGRQSAR
jgi:DNA polymerase III delta subunit